jgi:hypothetical protein
MTRSPRACAISMARVTATRFCAKGISKVRSMPEPERSLTRPKGVMATQVAPMARDSASVRSYAADPYPTPGW